MSSTTNVESLNANTPKNIIVDEGAVYLHYGTENETLLGAVSGANEFSYKIKTYQIGVGSVNDKIKGLDFIDSVSASLKCNFVEMTEDILKMALNAAVDTSDTTYDVLTPKSEFASTDYIDNVALIGTISGSQTPVIIILDDVLVTDGIDIKRERSKTNTLSVTFYPHGDPSTPKVIPFSVKYPKDNVAQA